MEGIESSTICDALLLELTSAEEPTQTCHCSGHLNNHGSVITCTTHDNCAQNTVSRVCLSCMRAYCAGCFNDLHQNPSLFGCLTLSYTTYSDIHRMFRSFGSPNKHKNGQLSMSVDDARVHYKNCIRKQKSSKHARRTLRELRASFGGDYQVTLLEFCRNYTKGNALSFSVVEAEPVQAFQSLNACGRCFYSCSKRGVFESSSFLCFSRMLTRIRSEQGENVFATLSTLYHLLLLNFIGLLCYIGLLFIPWILTDSLRGETSSDWTGLISGFGLDNLPIAFGGFPDYTFSPMNSAQHFNILLPIFIFAIFALATIYSFHLLARNRASFSETVASPALAGNVAATAFSMFKHSSTDSARNTKKAHLDFETNLRMAMVKKHHIADVHKSGWDKIKARNWFPMLLSFFLIIASALGLFFVDYFGISERYNTKERLGEYAKHYQLLMPAVFFFIKFIFERVTIALVKREVPGEIHLYNHFRAVLYYRLNFLNFCYLVCLIVLSALNERKSEPVHSSINAAYQVAMGWCTTVDTCECKPSKTGFFWYSYLVMWVYFELFTIILSIVRAIFQKCLLNVKTYFAPIPRLTQMFFLQALVWCSIFYLPSAIVIGFVATFLAFFSSYFKAQVLKAKPDAGVYLLPTKMQVYTAFILLLLTSYVPSAILFSQVPNCGAFVNRTGVHDNVFGQFSDATADFPVVLKQIFHYLTSPIVLWLLIICACAAIVALSRLAVVAKGNQSKLVNQLKIESHQRAMLIKQLGSNFKQEDSRGEALFVQWMMKVNQNPTISSASGLSNSNINLYLLKIQRKHPNLLDLIRLSQEQAIAVFLNCGCPLPVAEMFADHLQRFRTEVVLRTQRVL